MGAETESTEPRLSSEFTIPWREPNTSVSFFADEEGLIPQRARHSLLSPFKFNFLDLTKAVRARLISLVDGEKGM